jgi:hypothetical protein
MNNRELDITDGDIHDGQEPLSSHGKPVQREEVTPKFGAALSAKDLSTSQGIGIYILSNQQTLPCD